MTPCSISGTAKHLLVTTILLMLLVGCVSPGIQVTSNNNQVQMPHYSLVVPADVGWYLQVGGGPYEEVQIGMQPINSVVLFMRFIKNTIFDKNMRVATARQVADNYRELEKDIMIEKGVKTGMYKLSNLEMYEKNLGGKNFFIMRYVTDTGTQIQLAWLYLFFPKESNNDWFILAHYSVSAPKNQQVATREADFLSVLKSLQVR